ncbi:MAG: hypothetical protein ACXVCO_02135 [Ktedonobacterales bacterium]
MNGRLVAVRRTPRILTGIGVILLLAGSLLGWIVPRLVLTSPYLPSPRALIDGSGIDRAGFLGADITALAVIIAVVIGFNATTLQIAGQTHSLALVRAILLSLTPFLACWSLTTGVALVYFLLPPVYLMQFWQMLLWFAAVVVLMVAYLWELPWRLSGQYVALWALRGLGRTPVHDWEALDSYSALQTAVSAASVRGDLGTIRSITLAIGRFLVNVHDPRAEATPTYDRGRYRALKNLLSGCGQHAGDAPNSAAYQLGYVLAGILLQSVAVGHPMDDGDHDLYTGIFREFHTTPERLNPLWTGMRHALCRIAPDGEPYLLQFWLSRPRWPSDDLRRVTNVAEGIAAFHAGCWRELRATWPSPSAAAEARDMIDDLYRDLSVHLGKIISHGRHRTTTLRLPDFPLALLDKVHAELLRQWPTTGNGDVEAARVAVVNAYEARRTELLALIGQNR